MTLALAVAATATADAGRRRSTSGGGPLSRVVGGIKARAGGSSRPSSSRPSTSSGSNSSSNTDSGSQRVDSDRDDRGYYDSGDDIATIGEALSAVEGLLYLPFGIRAPTDTFYWDSMFAMQAVSHSDIGIHAESRLSLGNFVMSVGGGGWRETQPDSTEVELERWQLMAGARLRFAPWGHVTVEAGAAGLENVDFSATGAVLSASALAGLNRWIGLDATARAYVFSHDIRVYEGAAAVRLSWFRVGYRMTKFNVGPPLSGVEVGLALGL